MEWGSDIQFPNRIIADTNVFISLFLNPDVIGAPLKSLVTASYNYDLIFLTHILKELKEIPNEDKKLYKKLLDNNIDINRLLLMVSAFFADNIHDNSRNFCLDADIVKMLDDKDDEPVVQGMIETCSDLLLTSDPDFKRIAQFVDFEIMDPANFCRIYVNYPDTEIQISGIVKEYCDLLLHVRRLDEGAFLDVVRKMEESNGLSFNPLSPRK